MPKTARLTPEQRKANDLAYSRTYNEKQSTKDRTKAWLKTEAGKISAKNAQERYRAKKQGRESKAPPLPVRQTKEQRKEAGRLASIRFYAENPELCKQRKKAWRDANPEVQRALVKAWMAEHPEKVAEYALRSSHKRRMLLENQPGVDIEKWKQTLELFEYKCIYCRNPATSLDHVVPVSKGGTNHPTNCVPACKRCNCSKKDKQLGHWLRVSRIAKEALARPYDYEPEPQTQEVANAA